MIQRKFVSINKQKGAVMIEAAYVLPLILITILLIFDAVRYTTATFSANSVLWDLHKQIESDKISRSKSSTFISSYVSCVSGKVVMNSGENLAIKSMLVNGMGVEGYTINSPVAKVAEITNLSDEVGALKLYSVEFTGVLNSIIVPDAFMQKFPFKIYDLISMNQDCP